MFKTFNRKFRAVFFVCLAALGLQAEATSCFSPLLSHPSVSTLLKEREGFGKNATGGLNGECYQVTSSADAGPGTLRDAVENASGPRWIVFASNHCCPV